MNKDVFCSKSHTFLYGVRSGRYRAYLPSTMSKLHQATSYTRTKNTNFCKTNSHQKKRSVQIYKKKNHNFVTKTRSEYDIMMVCCLPAWEASVQETETQASRRRLRAGAERYVSYILTKVHATRLRAVVASCDTP